MTYDLEGRAEKVFVNTVRSMPRLHQVDLPPMLIRAGLFLALAGHIKWADELWQRALAPGMPPFRHYYGLDPLVAACAGAGLRKAPDGTDITAGEIDRIEVVTRLRLNPHPLTRGELGVLPSWQPPQRAGEDLLRSAMNLARPRDGTLAGDPRPSLGELQALGQFEDWLERVRHIEQWEKPEWEAVMLLSADIAERLGDRPKSSALVREWVRLGASPSFAIDSGSLFGLQSLSRLAADRVLTETLGLTDAACESAGRRLVEAADLRLKQGRAVSPVPFDWLSFLKSLSTRVLKTPGDHSATIPQGQRLSGWLGQKPASTKSIAAVEERLGHQLPSSYHAFLRVSNGFGPISQFVHRLRPVEKIDWFRNEDPKTLEIWRESTLSDDETDDAAYRMYGNYQAAARPRYLNNALQISDDFEGSVILLIPEVVTDSGEWETWYFGPAFVVAWRFPSFQELMEEGTLARTE